MLAAGADVNEQNKWGLTPLHLIARYLYDQGYYFITQLINRRADPSLQDQDGQSAVHLAVRHSDLLTIEQLASHSQPNIQDHTGNSPLHYAVRLSNIRAVDLLLVHKENPMLRNEYGESPLGLALIREHYIITKSLIAVISEDTLDQLATHELNRAKEFLTSIEEEKAAREASEKAAASAEAAKRAEYRASISPDWLARSAEKGEYGTLEREIVAGADVNRKGSQSNHPLHLHH